PSQVVLVQLIASPAADFHQRFGSEASQQRGPRAFGGSIVFGHRNNSGDGLPVTGDQDTPTLSDGSEEFREPPVRIRGRNRSLSLSHVVILTTFLNESQGKIQRLTTSGRAGSIWPKRGPPTN